MDLVELLPSLRFQMLHLADRIFEALTTGQASQNEDIFVTLTTAFMHEVEVIINNTSTSDFERLLESDSLFLVKISTFINTQNDHALPLCLGFSNFFRQCTYIFQILLKKAKTLCDINIYYRTLIFAETVLTADNKGSCNPFKRVFEGCDSIQGAQTGYLSGMRDSWRDLEVVGKGGLAWRKFYTFTSTGIKEVSDASLVSCVASVQPDSLLYNLTNLSGKWTQSLKRRICFFFESVVHQVSDSATEEYRKEILTLKNLQKDFGLSMGYSDFLFQLSSTEECYLKWKYGKETCPPINKFMRLMRNLPEIGAQDPSLERRLRLSCIQRKRPFRQFSQNQQAPYTEPLRKLRKISKKIV
jgi:hypothetical protein